MKKIPLIIMLAVTIPSCSVFARGGGSGGHGSSSHASSSAHMSESAHVAEPAPMAHVAESEAAPLPAESKTTKQVVEESTSWPFGVYHTTHCDKDKQGNCINKD